MHFIRPLLDMFGRLIRALQRTWLLMGLNLLFGHSHQCAALSYGPPANVTHCFGAQTGPSETKLQVSISTDKTVLELKKMIAEKTDVEAERQRLIYSGKVLKVSFVVCKGRSY